MNKAPFADITLDFPIDIAGANVTALRMRRPKARDEFKFTEGKGSEQRRMIELFADLCEITFDDVLNLDAVDLKKLADKLGEFKGQGRTNSAAQ